MARRDKLFAGWAANALKLDAKQEDALLTAVLHVDDGGGHDERVLTLVAARFAEAQLFPPDGDLVNALVKCEAEARRHMLDAMPGPI